LSHRVEELSASLELALKGSDRRAGELESCSDMEGRAIGMRR